MPIRKSPTSPSSNATLGLTLLEIEEPMNDRSWRSTVGVGVEVADGEAVEAEGPRSRASKLAFVRPGTKIESLLNFLPDG